MELLLRRQPSTKVELAEIEFAINQSVYDYGFLYLKAPLVVLIQPPLESLEIYDNTFRPKLFQNSQLAF